MIGMLFIKICSSRFWFISLLLIWIIQTEAKTVLAVVPPYKITMVKAMLFYDKKGTFSRDIFVKPDFVLFNTVAGEGDAESASTATLVLVEVTGRLPKEENPPNRKVELTATAAGKIILKRATYIGLYEGDTKFFAAFWLYDTGCERIKLTARIIGQTQISTVTKTIPFECGE